MSRGPLHTGLVFLPDLAQEGKNSGHQQIKIESVIHSPVMSCNVMEVQGGGPLQKGKEFF